MRVVFFTGLVWLSVLSAPAAAQELDLEVKGASAEVTYLEGNAFIVTPEMAVLRSLAPGDLLRQGERLRVADKSKTELLLPDNSHIRFEAGTVAELKSLSIDCAARRRAVGINMIMGKIWATVSETFPPNERFEISIRTSVATIRGTIYRMNVNEDQSAVVKVYKGEVEVKKALTPPPETPGITGRASRPQPGEGAESVYEHPPVSAGEWVYIVGPMQQLAIRADGTASEPAPFSAEEEMNDWVRWNRLRDKVLRQGTE